MNLTCFILGHFPLKLTGKEKWVQVEKGKYYVMKKRTYEARCLNCGEIRWYDFLPYEYRTEEKSC